jgi:Ca2+:H+ antiporter
VTKKILYFMLAFAPIALIVDLSNGDPVLVFILAALGIIPLADLIGEGTEELAAHTGPRLGGLLNATLGNAAELIITIFAIKEGLMALVLASITGSILGNLLLVLGMSIFLGGVRNGIQSFDRRQASLNSTLVILAVLALMIPSFFDTAFNLASESEAAAELAFSEGVAVVMIMLYALSVVYTFKSGSASGHESVAHKARWSMGFAIGVLAAATIATVFLSEILVGSVTHVTESLGLTEFFIGIIIIPLVGNVAEHLVAVEVALKNNMELSLAVSLGSSLQVALFVAPLLVFISLLFDQRLVLVFKDFELIALGAASLIAAFVAHDGESNWFEGAMLLAVYLIVGLAFFYLPAHG